MGIKKGTLVKAWDDDPSEYVIAVYFSHCTIKDEDNLGDHGVFNDKGMISWFLNAIPLPPELAKQLEEFE